MYYAQQWQLLRGAIISNYLYSLPSVCQSSRTLKLRIAVFTFHCFISFMQHAFTLQWRTSAFSLFGITIRLIHTITAFRSGLVVLCF